MTRQPGPEIWAWPNLVEAALPNYQGAPETAAAWTSPDWDDTVARCDVLGIYVGPANNGGPTGQDGIIVNLIEMATRYGKQIAVEIGAGGADTGEPSTGAASAALDLAGYLSYFAALGRVPDYLQMDGPMWRWMHIAAPKSISQAAAEVVAFMQTVHAVYPAIQFGIIQTPTAFFDVSVGATWTALMDAVDAAGEVIAFHHLDHPYEQAYDPTAMPQYVNQFSAYQRVMQDASIARAVPFGLTVNSLWGSGETDGSPFVDGAFTAPVSPSDAEFQKRCMWYAEVFRQQVEQGVLLAPDNLLIQSFRYSPRDMAPDTTDYTFCDTVLKCKAVFNSNIYKAL